MRIVLGTTQLVGQRKNQQRRDFEIAQRIVENPERTRDRVPSVQTVCRLRVEHLFRAKRHVRLQPFLSDLVGHVRPSVPVHVESKNRVTPGCTVKWSDFDRFADNCVRYYSKTPSPTPVTKTQKYILYLKAATPILRFKI